MTSKQVAILYILLCWMITANSFQAISTPTRRSNMTMKRGRGSFQEDTSSGSSSAGNKGWFPIPGTTTANLPTREREIKLVDTNAPILVNAATSPAGAVAIVKYGPSLYCTSATCASCKIPLNKADVLGPAGDCKDPRVACSFCRATYNLKTGQRVESAEGGGFMTGIVKNIMSKAPEGAGNLPVYALGEKEGQVLINFGNSS